MKYIITGYFKKAMESTAYKKMEDEGYTGRLPECKRVVAFAETLKNMKRNYNLF